MDYFISIQNKLKEAKTAKIEQHSLCVDAMRRGDHKAALEHMTAHACYTLQVREFTRVINSHLYHMHAEV